MKAKIFVRVGKDTASGSRTIGRSYVAAGSKVSHQPLTNANGLMPTVAFAISVDVPDELFRQAEKTIAELDVTAQHAKVAAEIQTPE